MTYKKNFNNDDDDDIKIDNLKTKTIYVQFDINFISSMSFINIKTFIERVKFYIVQTDAFFLFCLSNINRLKIYFNNIANIFVIENNNNIIFIVRRFEHSFLL